MCKNTGKNKSLNSEYSQKLLDQAKQSATDAFKTSSKRVIKKTAEATRDEITVNEITDKITKFLKNVTTK